MRDWLWKYGPAVIRQQLALRRALKERGHYPKPLGDAFVRDYTQHCVRSSIIINTISKPAFRRYMKDAPKTIDHAIRHQRELAQTEPLPAIDYLVMRHLGYFQQDIIEEEKAERRAEMIKFLEEAKYIAEENSDETIVPLIGRALGEARSKQSTLRR